MRKYQYGDCIPVSEIAYKRLKQKGYNPVLVAGFVIPFDEDLYFEYNWEAKNSKIPHTWVLCNNHLIDLTKNQFDIYGGIYEYIKLYYYKISDDGRKIVIRKALKEIKKVKL